MSAGKLSRKPLSIKELFEQADDEYIESFISRFWEKVQTGPTDSCWEWQACTITSGYGQITYCHEGKETYLTAHRVSAFLNESGESIEDYQVCHHCDNPKCVNPAHTYLGSAKDNVQDAIEAGTHISVRRGKR
jgi:hypothetical protein